MDKNLERAKRIAEGWPKWKRDFQLTKYSTPVTYLSGHREKKVESRIVDQMKDLDW